MDLLIENQHQITYGLPAGGGHSPCKLTKSYDSFLGLVLGPSITQKPQRAGEAPGKFAQGLWCM